MNQEKVQGSKILLYFIFIISIFLSCKDNSKNSKTNNNKVNINNDMTEKVLIAQLESGCSEDYPYEYSKNDLNVTIPIIKNKLISGGFKIIDRTEFNKKIYSIFKRTIDNKSDGEYLYVNFLENCNKEMNFQINNFIDYQGSFVIKNDCFITDFYAIPQIIDYQKDYPNASKTEDKPIIVKNEIEETDVKVKQWKEVTDLTLQRSKNVQKIVARNKYLFNDSKVDFVWLQFNDVEFLQSLVKIFGYVDDKELLKFVLDKEKYDGNNSNEFNKLLWHKTCDGKLIFHKETLELMAEDKAKKQAYFDILNSEYIRYLVNEKIQKELSFSEKAEIIANILNFIQTHSKNYDVYNNMGGFAEWYDNGNNDDAYSKEFEKHNYYNLPDFEKQWKEAKVEGNGIALPGEE